MDDQLALGDSLSRRTLIVSCSSPNSALNINAFLCKMRTYGLSEVDNLSANLSQNDLILKLSQKPLNKTVNCGGSIYLYQIPWKEWFCRLNNKPILFWCNHPQPGKRQKGRRVQIKGVDNRPLWLLQGASNSKFVHHVQTCSNMPQHASTCSIIVKLVQFKSCVFSHLHRIIWPNSGQKDLCRFVLELLEIVAGDLGISMDLAHPASSNNPHKPFRDLMQYVYKNVFLMK